MIIQLKLNYSVSDYGSEDSGFDSWLDCSLGLGAFGGESGMEVGSILQSCLLLNFLWDK